MVSDYYLLRAAVRTVIMLWAPAAVKADSWTGLVWQVVPTQVWHVPGWGGRAWPGLVGPVSVQRDSCVQSRQGQGGEKQ